jgi:hypothetical protein
MVIEIVDGNNQTARAGQAVPKPLRVRVTQSGMPVANQHVTFTVTAGGGAIGDVPPAVPGPTIAPSTNAAGETETPIWQLGATAGDPQQVVAKIPNGAFVTFNATATAAPAVNPPVVRAIWPPNGAELGPNSPNPDAKWFRRWRESQLIQITFDRKMRASQVQAPDPWLRMWAIIKNPGGANVTTPFAAIRILLGHSGTVATPILGVSGVTEEYRAEVPRIVNAQEAHFLVQIEAKGGNIMDAGGAPLLLDAEFEGTKLTAAQLDALFPLGGISPVTAAEFAAYVGTGATLPQSGDGTPGGRFHSIFTVFG